MGDREKWVAIALIPALLAPPWFLGGMRWWQQLIFLGLAIPPFVLCFVPFGDEVRGKKREALTRLLRLPPFCLALAFLLYLSLGAWNYSWEYTLTDNGTQWFMQQLPADKYLHWLPNGVRAVFTEMNPWRVVIIYSTALLLTCSIGLGIRRGRVLWFLVAVIGFNAFLIALLTILQGLSNAQLIYWTFESANRNFAGPFQYRNHGAAYLYLGLACCLGCAFYHWKRFLYASSFKMQDRPSLRSDTVVGVASQPTSSVGLSMPPHKRSNPALLFLFFALVIVMGIVFANSRAGLLFGGFIGLVAFLLFVVNSLHLGRAGLIALVTVTLVIVLAGFLAKPYVQRTWPKWQQRLKYTEVQFESLSSAQGADSNGRVLINKATFAMFEAKPWMGWGAGAYRWIFPKFQWEYPSLFYDPLSIRRAERNPKRFSPQYQEVTYAHNDWLQSLTEFGILGTIPLFGILLYWVSIPIVYWRQCRSATLILFVGAGALLMHAFVDFVFQNPPDLLAFSVVATLAGKSLIVRKRRSTAYRRKSREDRGFPA